MAEQKIKGIVQSVARVNGKTAAKMVVEIPISIAGDIPLGEVFITIKPVQESMFDRKAVIRGADKKGKNAAADEDEDEDDE